MTQENTTLPPQDDLSQVSNEGQTEAELLDAVLRGSDFTSELYEEEPLPEEEVPEVDPDESDEIEDPEESEESVTEDESEEEVDEDEVEDDESEEDESTQDTEVYTADDLDLDAMVRVKIDGEEVDVTFEELLKGYQTDASISKKGRELGEARKELEEQKAAAMAELQQLGQASTAVLLGQEQELAKQYHSIEAEIEKARNDGDTYEVNELKDKREQVQKQYWKARKNREVLQSQLKEQQEKVQEQEWEKQLEYFSENIENEVPGFNADLAAEIREFAIGEGLDEQLVDTIADPVIVRVLNDYRKLKQGVSKGEAKRKAVPQKKAVPAKKAKSKAKVQEDKSKMTKARAFREDASADDQMAFLREYAQNSLKL